MTDSKSGQPVTPGTETAPATTQTVPPAQTTLGAETPPAEFKADPNKSAAENETAKAAFEAAKTAPAAKPGDKKDGATALGAEDAPKPLVDKDGKPVPEGFKLDKDGNAVKEEPPKRAPEKYEPFKLEDQEIDAAEVAAFEPIAKELDLTQEQAQKLVKLRADLRTAELKEWSDKVDGWLTSSKSDKEIGGTGWDGNIAIAKKAINEFGTKELKTALNEFGMGNHPEFIRFAFKVGQALGESSTRTTAAGAETGEKRSAAEVLYGGTPPAT